MRGFRARLISKILKKTLRMKKKYFLDEEFWETISANIFDENTKLVKTDHIYTCSGAKYSGEWKGGFRYGTGTMKWTDGAAYKGSWMMGRAYG